MAAFTSVRSVRGRVSGCALAISLWLLAGPASVSAAIYFVTPNGDDTHDGLSWAAAKQTVTAGLAAATAGDQVWVAAGTYFERITLQDAVALYGGFAGSEDPASFDLDDRAIAANATILDGSSTGVVVTTPYGATADWRVDGFTITHGQPMGPESGGGMHVGTGSPTIAHNTIRDNSGTGLWAHVNAAPLITDNLVLSNGGDGIVILGDGIVSNNVIVGNGAAGVSTDNSAPLIVSNRIVGNSGPGLELLWAGALVANNVISDNHGGVRAYYRHVLLINNTITGNVAGADGAALYLEDAPATIVNTIIAFNSSGITFSAELEDAVTFRNSCIFDNGQVPYWGVTNPVGTNGNIAVDPRLADPAHGNHHIQPDSPCVDAGNNADLYGDTDVDGQPRVWPTDGVVDIGADESDGTLWAPGPYATIHVSQTGDDAHDGSSWALAKQTLQAGINAAAVAGGEVWVQAGTYFERIRLHPYAHAYGGFGGDETVRDARDWAANVTVLDGQQQGSVVTAGAGQRVSTLDGFTITHGQAVEGGGLSLRSAGPTIAHNTITGNTAETGGGLYGYFASPTVVDNAIVANSASAGGGGLYLERSSAVIANNVIAVNTAYEGGGVYLDAVSSSGYVYGSYTPPILANNLIAANSASLNGGGIRLNYSSARVVNNTIVGNNYGGLRLYGSSGPQIFNNIVAFNGSVGISGSYASAFLQYNCTYGSTSNYSGVTNPTGTNGNISADPLFVDLANGDCRLAAGSPCIDAGNNARVPADTFDLDGDGDTSEPLPWDLGGLPRFVDDPATLDCPWGGDCGTAPLVDMGAYEFQPAAPPACLGDVNCDGSVTFADIDPFVARLGCPDNNPACGTGCPWQNADINGDGAVTFADINPFVAQLGTTCP